MRASGNGSGARAPRHAMLPPMRSLEGRAVLVTGAGGFIGGHVVERLVNDGARVRALCRYNSRNERGTLDWLAPEVTADLEVVLGELRDVESVSDAVAGM